MWASDRNVGLSSLILASAEILCQILRVPHYLPQGKRISDVEPGMSRNVVAGTEPNRNGQKNQLIGFVGTATTERDRRNGKNGPSKFVVGRV